MNHGLADFTVGAANADVLVRAAEAALAVALEVGEHEQGIVGEQMLAHVHLRKPLAAVYRQGHSAILVHDVHGRERPAVVQNGFAVLFGGIAVAGVIGVGFDDDRAGQVALQKRLHPRPGDDVGAVFFAGVQFHAHIAGDVAADARIDFAQARGGEVAREVDEGFVALALRIGNVMIPARSRDDLLAFHIPYLPGCFPVAGALAPAPPFFIIPARKAACKYPGAQQKGSWRDKILC